MSLNSEDEDEYHYSDLEDEEDEEQQAAHEAVAGDAGALSGDEDEDEYQYSEEDEADAAAELQAKPQASRRSPGGAAAKKKKRVMDTAAAAAHRAGDDYRVIDEEELFQEQRQLVRELAQVLELPVSHAAVLLRHFAWNKEKLFEGYYSDPRLARAEAGLEFADKPSPTFAPDASVREARRALRFIGLAN